MSENGPGDYEVGYGKPPQQSKYRKGQSGNPKGRPKKKKGPIDITDILEEPVDVLRNGRRQKMQPFEASIRRLVQKAIKEKNLTAIREFLEICEKFEVIKAPEPEWQGGVLTAPPGVDFKEWRDSIIDKMPVDDDNE